MPLKKNLNLIFWGLLFLFLEYKINHIDVLHDVIGMIMLTTGTARLREVSPLFRRSFLWVLIGFGHHFFAQVLEFSLLSRVMPMSLVIAFLEFVIQTMMVYFIAQALSEIAAEHNRPQLAAFVQSTFAVFLLAGVVACTALFTEILPAVMAVAAAILSVPLLLAVHKVVKKSEDWDDEPMPKAAKLAKKLVCVACVTGCLVLGLGVAWVGDIQTAVVMAYDRGPGGADIGEIRDQMVALGMPAADVNDLPDDEIALLAGVKKLVKASSEEMECSGGLLQFTQYTFSINTQDHRFIMFYRWKEKPSLAHAEVVGIKIPESYDRLLAVTDVTALHLFDRDGETQQAEGKINDRESRHKVSKFAMPRDAENFRGYIACSVALDIIGASSFSNGYYYVHQPTFLTDADTDIEVMFTEEGSGTKGSKTSLLIKDYYYTSSFNISAAELE